MLLRQGLGPGGVEFHHRRSLRPAAATDGGGAPLGATAAAWIAGPAPGVVESVTRHLLQLFMQ